METSDQEDRNHYSNYSILKRWDRVGGNIHWTRSIGLWYRVWSCSFDGWGDRLLLVGRGWGVVPQEWSLGGPRLRGKASLGLLGWFYRFGNGRLRGGWGGRGRDCMKLGRISYLSGRVGDDGSTDQGMKHTSKGRRRNISRTFSYTFLNVTWLEYLTQHIFWNTTSLQISFQPKTRCTWPVPNWHFLHLANVPLSPITIASNSLSKHHRTSETAEMTLSTIFLYT